MADTVGVKTIAGWSCLNASAMGNPRYEVTFTDGLVAQTQVDAAVNYDVENLAAKKLQPVMVTFTTAGRIKYMRLATPEERKGDE